MSVSCTHALAFFRLRPLFACQSTSDYLCRVLWTLSGVMQVGQVPQRDNPPYIHVASGGIDCVTLKVFAQSFWLCLRKELEGSFSLLNEVHCGLALSKPLHHPGCIQCSKKSTSKARTSRPKWLEGMERACTYSELIGATGQGSTAKDRLKGQTLASKWKIHAVLVHI